MKIKDLIIIILICLIGILIINSSEEEKFILLSGTYSKAFENLVFQSISLDGTKGEYIYKNQWDNKLIEETGMYKFKNKNKYEFTSGIFEGYIIEVHNKYIDLITPNGLNIEQYSKTSDLPTYF